MASTSKKVSKTLNKILSYRGISDQKQERTSLTRLRSSRNVTETSQQGSNASARLLPNLVTPKEDTLLVTTDLATPEPNHLCRCHKCGNTFRDESHLKLHVEIFHPSKPYLCDNCDATYVTEGVLRRHKWQKHGIDLSGLGREIKEKRNNCGTQSSTGANVTAPDIDVKHEPGSYVDKEIQARSNNSVNAITKRVDRMKQELDNVENNASINASVNISDIKQEPRDDAEIQMDMKSSAQILHERENEMDLEPELDNDVETQMGTLRDITIKPPKSIYICHKCKATFRLATLLKIHNDVHHLKIKRFACKRCDAAFVSNKRLERHERQKHGKVYQRRRKWREKTNFETIENAVASMQVNCFKPEPNFFNGSVETCGIVTATTGLERGNGVKRENDAVDIGSIQTAESAYGIDIKQEIDLGDSIVSRAAIGFSASESNILDEDVDDDEDNEDVPESLDTCELPVKTESTDQIKTETVDQKPENAPTASRYTATSPQNAAEPASVDMTPITIQRMDDRHPLTCGLYRAGNIDALDTLQVICLFKVRDRESKIRLW